MEIVIIDDDFQFSIRMKNDLLNHFSKYDEDVKIDIINHDFYNQVNGKQYLFYFVDIDLKDVNGFDLVYRIKQSHKNSYFVFVSSHNDLFHESFNVRALYFIRKSYYREDLNTFYDIVDNELINSDIFVELNYKMSRTQISLNQIVYLESQNHSIKVVTNNNETFYDNRKLKDWIELLPNDKFIQIHRSYIINIDRLISQRKRSLIMTNKEELVIGRTFKNKFDQFYQEYLLR